MELRKHTNRCRILGYAYYREQIEMPVFHQYEATRELNAGYHEQVGGTTVTQVLNSCIEHGFVGRIPDNGQATIDAHPYLQPLYPGRPARKYFQITERGKEHFYEQLMRNIGIDTDSASMEELFRPKKVALFLANHPTIQQTILENLAGFPADHFEPISFVDLSDTSSRPQTITEPADPVAIAAETEVEALLAQSNITL